MIRKQWKALLTSMVLFLTGTALVTAQSGETHGQVGLIVTHDSGRAWLPLNAPEGLDGAKAFQETFDEMAREFPEDLKLSLGGFSTGAASGETAYNSAFVSFYSSRDFDAVNVTAKDYRNYAAAGMGLSFRPEQDRNRYLSSLNPKSIDVPMPVMKTVKAGDHEIRLVSLSNLDDLSGFTDLVSLTTAEKAADVLSRATRDFDGTVVLLSDFPPSTNDEFARQYEGLDVIFERQTHNASQRSVGKTIIQATDRPGTMQRVVLQLGDGGQAESVQTQSRSWISASDYEALFTIPTPIIGMSVQPPETVTSRFGIKAENVQIDVHRGVSFPELTSRENIYTYHLNLDGNEFHFYRLYHRFPGEQQRAWIPVDMLVLVNPDNTIRGVETNLATYPVDVFSTKMGSVLSDLFGKPADQWEINPELIRGYEESAWLIIDDLRKTLELDKQLYPTGYLEPKQ